MGRKARWVVAALARYNRYRRTVVSLLLPILAAASAHPAVAQDAAAEDVALTPIVVALPEGPSPRTIGYYLAEAGGWFAGSGLDPEFVIADKRGPSGMLAAGDAELAIDIMPHALEARAGGADIIHVAQVFQSSGLVLACRKSIKEPKDLKGMTISLWSDGQDGAFYAWMAKIGLGIYGEADGVTILREGLDPDAYRQRTSDCFTGQSYALPAQLALQGRTTYDYRIFSYEAVGTATLEDGVYARAQDLKYPDRVERIARVLSAMRAGWQSAADEAREAAEFLAGVTPPPVPELAILLRSIWAANDLVQVDRVPFGVLNPAAYDRTVTILLTAAPDPLLKTAPRGATSDVAIKALEALD